MKVDLLRVSGTDLDVVNVAKVSFNKLSEWEEHFNTKHGMLGLSLADRDKKLIYYLAIHGHWSPFSHCSLSFRIKAPIFVARQLIKHQIGLAWNEVSRRYVDYVPEFYKVTNWRGRPVTSKQGSSKETVDVDNNYINCWYGAAIKLYEMLLEQGVAPEQARIVLPQAMYTEWIWTGSLYAFARVCNLRNKPDAQEETRMITEQIAEHCNKAFPISWSALCGTK